MLKLYGVSVSNYYNKVKLALLEKGVPFEEEWVNTGKDAIAAGSPIGKVPFLKTPQGLLFESIAIADYLEETYPTPALYPRDTYLRGKCRELILFIELYLELPARRLYDEAFFGARVSEETKNEAREDLEKGLTVLGNAVKFGPYILGGEFTHADCSAYGHLPLVSRTIQKIYGEDLLARISGVGSYLEQLSARPSVKKVSEDRKASLERFMAAKRA